MTSTISPTAIILSAMALGTICGCSESASEVEIAIELRDFRESMRPKRDSEVHNENGPLMKGLVELNRKQKQAVSELESTQQRRKALEVEIASADADLARLKKDVLVTVKQQTTSLAVMTRELGELRREIDCSRRDLEVLKTQRREAEQHSSQSGSTPSPATSCCQPLPTCCRPRPRTCR